MLPERLEFVWRPWEKNNYARIPINVSLQILARCGPAFIRKDDSAFDNVGLFGIVRRHGDAPLGKALIHRSDNVVIALDFDAKRCSHALAREVILRGTKTAGDNDDVRTADG